MENTTGQQVPPHRSTALTEHPSMPIVAYKGGMGHETQAGWGVTRGGNTVRCTATKLGCRPGDAQSLITPFSLSTFLYMLPLLVDVNILMLESGVALDDPVATEAISAYSREGRGSKTESAGVS